MLDKVALSNFQELGDNLSIIVLARSENLEDNSTDIAKELMVKSKKCLYITVNQPFNRMLYLLNKKGIDTSKISFIDCITKTSGGKEDKGRNVFYVDSPSNLTDLNISINEVLNSIKGLDLLIFDALSTLAIYNKSGALAKFTHSVMTKVKSMGIKGIFIIVKGEIDENVFSKIEQFSDTTIDISQD